jgi:hypothetical protein
LIPYRPIAPLTVSSRKGWKSVMAAVVMAAMLGTTATAAVGAEPATRPSSVQYISTAAAPDLQAVEQARRES